LEKRVGVAEAGGKGDREKTRGGELEAGGWMQPGDRVKGGEE